MTADTVTRRTGAEQMLSHTGGQRGFEDINKLQVSDIGCIKEVIGFSLSFFSPPESLYCISVICSAVQSGALS